jgi:hypothetical protein
LISDNGLVSAKASSSEASSTSSPHDRRHRRGPVGGRRFFAAALVAGLGLAAACTLLVDRNAKQCSKDSDCEHFGALPLCQKGVCVPSGLGPPHCFEGTPSSPEQFMNACSPATCFAFDNCARLGLCDGGVDDGALVPPPAPDAGAPSTTPPPSDGGTTLPSCVDPSNGRSQVVYITGSSNFPPLLAKLAPLLIQTGYTPVYQVTSSCNGVKSMFSAQTKDHLITDPPAGSKAAPATYAAADGTLVPCSLGASGAVVDVGESDIFSTTCAGGEPPNSVVGEYLGPIQAMLFVVPGRSRELAISAEAARSVFGRGGDNQKATPWVNPSSYFVRNANTGTQQLVGHAIAVAADQFWGVDRGTAKNVDLLLRVIADDAAAQEAIGIVSNDISDGDPGNLKALAFKQTGQSCAYLADSTANDKDKQNVRDGHYPIWGPLHFFAAISNGVPVSPAAQVFLSAVSVPELQKELLDAFIDSKLVPSCAMKVTRDSELGDLRVYAPPVQCGCYFQMRATAAVPSECTVCTSTNDCPSARPVCFLGYCEKQ